jgi:hypothetical protein
MKKACVSEKAPAFTKKSRELLLRRLLKLLTALNVTVYYSGW